MQKILHQTHRIKPIEYMFFGLTSAGDFLSFKGHALPAVCGLFNNYMKNMFYMQEIFYNLLIYLYSPSGLDPESHEQLVMSLTGKFFKKLPKYELTKEYYKIKEELNS